MMLYSFSGGVQDPSPADVGNFASWLCELTRRDLGLGLMTVADDGRLRRDELRRVVRHHIIPAFDHPRIVEAVTDYLYRHLTLQ